MNPEKKSTKGRMKGFILFKLLNLKNVIKPESWGPLKDMVKM